MDWIACNRSAIKARALEQERQKEPGDDWWHVLLFCAECMRIQSFLSGEKSDRIHAMAGRSLSSQSLRSEPKPSDADQPSSWNRRGATPRSPWLLCLLGLFFPILPPTAPPLLIITGSWEVRSALKPPVPVPRRCPSISPPTNKQAGAREPFVPR